MKKCLYIYCVLLLTAGLSQRSYAGFIFKNGAKSVRIPIEVQNNIILLPLQINGSFEMNFILDTGVRSTILTEPMIADFLNLKRSDSLKIRGLGEGEPITAYVAKDIELEMPGVRGKGMRVVILPPNMVSYSSMFGKPVHGIIGYDVFGQFVVEINYRHKYVRLTDPFHFKHRRGLGKEMPLRIVKGKPYVQASLVDQFNDTLTTEWLIDTGASQAISLFDEDLRVPDPKIRTFLGKGLSGDVHGFLGRIEEFNIGGFVFDDVIAGYPEPDALGMINSISWYGNLGAEIISRFTVIFDYHRGKLRLKKNSKFSKPFTYNLSGLELIAGGKGFDSYFVSYVRPNSPAFIAGLEVRDEILSMNGYALKELNLDDVYLTLNRKPGRSLSLKVLRDGEVLKKKMVLFTEL